MNKSPLVNYEIANTYFALKDYQKAIEHIDVVLAAKSDYIDKAYTLKGSALDLSGKSTEAIRMFEEAIKQYPNNYLLYYNMGLAFYNMEKDNEAATAMQKALKVNPKHATSHLLLAYIMREQNSRVKSLLAIYNFLLLEPKGKRAQSGYNLLESQLKKGVTRCDEKSIDITLKESDASDEFSAAELMLSLLEASKSLEENKNKTEYELFADNTKSFFTVLGELKKGSKDFWWNYYVDFFAAMVDSKHVEAFSYYISQSKDDKKISTWLDSNKGKVDALLLWVSNYKRKY